MIKFFNKLNYTHMIIMQVMVIIGVSLLFRYIPDKKIASIFASLLFIILSGILVYLEFIKPGKWQNPLFITAGIFLVFIAIPMAVTRFLNWDLDFSQIKIWWLEGPVFHSISRYFFMAMTIATIWNLIAARRKS